MKYLSFVRIVCVCVCFILCSGAWYSHLNVFVLIIVCLCYNIYIYVCVCVCIKYGLVFGLLALKMKSLQFSETSAHTQSPTRSLHVIYSLPTKEFFRLSVFHLPPCCLTLALSSFLHSSQYRCVFNIFDCFFYGCNEAR